MDSKLELKAEVLSIQNDLMRTLHYSWDPWPKMRKKEEG
jgi:hypothetical protein